MCTTTYLDGFAWLGLSSTIEEAVAEEALRQQAKLFRWLPFLAGDGIQTYRLNGPLLVQMGILFQGMTESRSLLSSARIAVLWQTSSLNE